MVLIGGLNYSASYNTIKTKDFKIFNKKTKNTIPTTNNDAMALRPPQGKKT